MAPPLAKATKNSIDKIHSFIFPERLAIRLLVDFQELHCLLYNVVGNDFGAEFTAQCVEDIALGINT